MEIEDSGYTVIGLPSVGAYLESTETSVSASSPSSTSTSSTSSISSSPEETKSYDSCNFDLCFLVAGSSSSDSSTTLVAVELRTLLSGSANGVIDPLTDSKISSLSFSSSSSRFNACSIGIIGRLLSLLLLLNLSSAFLK